MEICLDLCWFFCLLFPVFLRNNVSHDSGSNLVTRLLHGPRCFAAVNRYRVTWSETKKGEN